MTVTVTSYFPFWRQQDFTFTSHWKNSLNRIKFCSLIEDINDFNDIFHLEKRQYKCLQLLFWKYSVFIERRLFIHQTDSYRKTTR